MSSSDSLVPDILTFSWTVYSNSVSFRCLHRRHLQAEWFLTSSLRVSPDRMVHDVFTKAVFRQNDCQCLQCVSLQNKFLEVISRVVSCLGMSSDIFTVVFTWVLTPSLRISRQGGPSWPYIADLDAWTELSSGRVAALRQCFFFRQGIHNVF